MQWVIDNWDSIQPELLGHLPLSLLPVLLTALVSVPLGWAANRIGLARGPFLAVLGLLYAVPSLALFVVLPLVFGFGLSSSANVVTALTIYGVALMVRPVADGFRAVDAAVLQAATAMGYGAVRRFASVELPLAVPVIVAGLRVVAVSTVSLVTVSSALGTKSLGLAFFDGLQRGIPEEIVAAIVLVVALAIALDALIALVGRALTPWRRAVRA